jgi:hypothetical protein
MIENIINLLEIAKQEKQTGEYTAIALGKNKLPESVREAFNIFRQELWQRNK